MHDHHLPPEIGHPADAVIARIDERLLPVARRIGPCTADQLRAALGDFDAGDVDQWLPCATARGLLHRQDGRWSVR